MVSEGPYITEFDFILKCRAMEFSKLSGGYKKSRKPANYQDAWESIVRDSAKSCIHVIQRNCCARNAQCASDVRIVQSESLSKVLDLPSNTL